MLAVLDSEGSTFQDNCVKSNKQGPILSAAKIYVNDSSFWQYKTFIDIRRRFLLERRQI